MDTLNAAFSQEDLIPYEADAVLCTLPLGVLKESVRLGATVNVARAETRRSVSSRSQSDGAAATSPFSPQLTKLMHPVFEPPLPTAKIESIQRLGFGVLNKVR